jgi:hypothetical protein
MTINDSLPDKEFLDILKKEGMEGILAKYDTVETVIEKLQQQITQIISDQSDDDTEIRELALTVLPDSVVNGDEYGVPDIVNITEALVKRIKQEMGNE